MKKKIMIFGILAIATLAIAGMIYASITLKQKEKIEDSHLISLTFKELQKKIDKKDSFILVITQEECSHCMEYKPVLKSVLTEYDIYAYELSLDKLSKKETAQLKDIANTSGTPNTVFIENGEEKNTSSRITGNKSKDKIISRLKAMGYIE